MSCVVDSEWIVRQRLRVQGIAYSAWRNAVDAVQSLVAVQAQDYLGSLWAVGLRVRGATEQTIEQALATRAIVRTWPMRGTLHLVAAEDVRWMLALLAPPIVAKHAKRMLNDFDLREKDFARSREVIAKALDRGQLSRSAMYRALDSARIATDGQRGLHILWRLAQDGVICLAARDDKQQTFALLDDWVPQTKRLVREQALGELARRYFSGHGPATLRDFTWWSGLAPADAKIALELAQPDLESAAIDDRNYWFGAAPVRTTTPKHRVHLLAAYDEYTVAYQDRSAVLDPQHTRRAGSGIFKPTLLVDGRIAGTWRRMLNRQSVVVTVSAFDRIPPALRQECADVVERYGAFVGLPATLKFVAA